MTTLTEEELRRLPVFPLPRVVFFPGSLLPLHLFEPRYRQMAKHCMTSGCQTLAIALLEPGYEDDYEGRPPFHPIAGVGRIVEHEELPDGTHNLLLHGVGRVRLDEQLPEGAELFRSANAKLIEDSGQVTPGELRTLMSCAMSVAAVVRVRHPDFELGVTPDDDASTIIDTIADRFVADPDERQAILEAASLSQRLDRTLGTVSELFAALAANQAPS